VANTPSFDILAGILTRPGMYMDAGSSWDALLGFLKGIEFAVEVHGLQDDVLDAWRRFTRWMVNEWHEALHGPFWPVFRAQYVDDLQALAVVRDAYQRYRLMGHEVLSD
jgi:hypothetical protein